MKRHLIIIYTVIIILVISGRYAWLHCQWDWVSRVSALAVIIGILIEHWNVLIGKTVREPNIEVSATSERLAILMLCLGTFLAGFGEMFGRLAFGCSGG
jgi:hypothetical protein